MTTFSSIPAEWGPDLHSRSYDFYIGGSTPIASPTLLHNHGMEAPSNDTIDEVTRDYEVRERGRYVLRRKTIRAQQVVRQTFNINVPPRIVSPVLIKARTAARGGATCLERFYGVLNCPEDSKFAHAVIWNNTVLRGPTRANAFRTINDQAVAEWTVEATSDFEEVLFTQGLFEMVELAEPMYAVVYLADDCPECDADSPWSGALAIGGDGGVADPVVVRRTLDRFATTTSLTTDAATNGHVGTCGLVDGAKALVGYASAPDVADVLSTTGGVLFWSDITASSPAAPSVDVGITEPIRGIAKFKGAYVAVGGTAAGAAVVYTSTDGINWTAVVSAALPAADAATSIAVDEANEVLYVTCENGTLLKGYVSGSTIAFSDISSLLSGVTTQALYVVKVFAPGHVAVGGDTGIYNEMFPGDTTFTAVALPGATDVFAVDGTKDRAVSASGATVYVRDILTEFNYTAKTVEDGASFGAAVVRGIVVPPGGYESNYAILCLDDGTIGLLRPYFPGA